MNVQSALVLLMLLFGEVQAGFFKGIGNFFSSLFDGSNDDDDDDNSEGSDITVTLPTIGENGLDLPQPIDELFNNLPTGPSTSQGDNNFIPPALLNQLIPNFQPPPFFLEGFITNLTCDEADTSKQDFDCILPGGFAESQDSTKNGGIWACRSLHNTLTGDRYNHTVCVNPEVAFVSDSCGCCDGVCPEACTCPCPDGSDRVSIDITFLDSSEQSKQKCVHAQASSSLVAMSDKFSCSIC